MGCRIVLADDHVLIRHGIKRIIEEEESLKVVGEVGDGLELLDFLKKTTPDLIILDISMPNLRGIEAIREVKKVCPDVKVLILTMHKSVQYLCSAMSEGANGYLLKEDSDTELIPAIESVMEDKTYISPFLSKEFSDDVMQACHDFQKIHEDALTTRERQILKLVADGETNREIAELLSISKRTVEHHRANILKKLNIKNTADLIKYAIENGYVSSPRPE